MILIINFKCFNTQVYAHGPGHKSHEWHCHALLWSLTSTRGLLKTTRLLNILQVTDRIRQCFFNTESRSSRSILNIMKRVRSSLSNWGELYTLKSECLAHSFHLANSITGPLINFHSLTKLLICGERIYLFTICRTANPIFRSYSKLSYLVIGQQSGFLLIHCVSLSIKSRNYVIYYKQLPKNTNFIYLSMTNTCLTRSVNFPNNETEDVSRLFRSTAHVYPISPHLPH